MRRRASAAVGLVRAERTPAPVPAAPRPRYDAMVTMGLVGGKGGGVYDDFIRSAALTLATIIGAQNISVPRERKIVGGDASPAACRFRRREASSSCVSRAMTRAGSSFVASDGGVAAAADGEPAVVASVHRRWTYLKAIHRPGARLSMLMRLLLVPRARVQPRVHFSLLASLTAVSPSSGSQNPCAH